MYGYRKNNPRRIQPVNNTIPIVPQFLVVPYTERILKTQRVPYAQYSSENGEKSPMLLSLLVLHLPLHQRYTYILLSHNTFTLMVAILPPFELCKFPLTSWGKFFHIRLQKCMAQIHPGSSFDSHYLPMFSAHVPPVRRRKPIHSYM